ncbi:MAG: Polyketide cyclase/dehydrase [Acidimicrobiales bacterium]|nr:Polyketide cyclase/dehydrase [Acidimicrobiales bacterium]
MKVIEHSIEIAAAPQAVWDVLMNTDAYSEWNPFLTMDRAPVAVGDRLSVTIRPGRRTMTFRPTVTAFEPRHELSWLGRVVAPGVFDGTHTLALEPLANGHTRFLQREIFRGALVPLMKSVLRNTSDGFAAMNAALATRVETQVAIGEV